MRPAVVLVAAVGVAEGWEGVPCLVGRGVDGAAAREAAAVRWVAKRGVFEAREAAVWAAKEGVWTRTCPETRSGQHRALRQHGSATQSPRFLLGAGRNPTSQDLATPHPWRLSTRSDQARRRSAIATTTPSVSCQRTSHSRRQILSKCPRRPPSPVPRGSCGGCRQGCRRRPQRPASRHREGRGAPRRAGGDRPRGSRGRCARREK